MSQTRLRNLKNVIGLVADRDVFTRGLITKMLRGFGIDTNAGYRQWRRKPKTSSGGQSARTSCLMEGALPDMNSARPDRLDPPPYTPDPLRFKAYHCDVGLHPAHD